MLIKKSLDFFDSYTIVHLVTFYEHNTSLRDLCIIILTIKIIVEMGQLKYGLSFPLAKNASTLHRVF